MTRTAKTQERNTEDRRDRITRWALATMQRLAEEGNRGELKRVYLWASGKMGRSYRHQAQIQDAYAWLLALRE